MAIRKRKPTTPTQRFTSVSTFEEVTQTKPYKPLTIMKKSSGGRNSHGHVTCRHRGGGHKRRYRIVDFRRDKYDMQAVVKTIEYDPNRTARLALIEYADGEKRYMIAPDGLKVGDTVMSGQSAEIKTGNHLPLSKIPAGTPVHNIELRPKQGAKLVRAAGGVAQIAAKEAPFAHIKMPSGEVRMIKLDCYATIGQCSNSEQENISLGKAGRRRWMGFRPSVRGVAMNPVDHPLGGGEGKSSGGRHPSSPWGKPSKGLKTRKRNKSTNKFIVKDRRK